MEDTLDAGRRQSPFLKLDSLTKQYGDYLAVNQISLSIPKASIYGLLGPNGAGKTSTIRMITGITAPDKGQIWFDGNPLKKGDVYRMGYMPEERGLYKKMKVGEQIIYLLRLKGLSKEEANKKCREWLKKFELAQWADHKTSDLSKGMQQKVQFITTVAHDPLLLILDEPFSGLDPVNTQIIEQEIHRLKEKGTTIIFSTHRMEQVEELCDHIALINKGKVMIEENLQTVRKKFQKNVYDLVFEGDGEVIREIPSIEVISINSHKAQIKVNSDARTVMQHLTRLPLEIERFARHIPKLQDIFIELVQSRDPQATINTVS